jgi:hypothetical protein
VERGISRKGGANAASREVLVRGSDRGFGFLPELYRQSIAGVNALAPAHWLFLVAFLQHSPPKCVKVDLDQFIFNIKL